MATLPQVKSISMRESVGEAIRQALYGRRFEPGQSLSEVGLANEMGISRGPVREALLLLVQEGLVTHSPNRGFSVVQITTTDVQEIHSVRVPLETTALVMAKPRITEHDIAKLEELKDKMVIDYGNQNVLLCSQSDMAFHRLIWDCTGNTRLSDVLRNLLAPLFAYGSLFNSHRRPDLSTKLIGEEHDLMIQFLSGQIDCTAEDCVRFHLGL
jgi:DNA-binding GntR family transcriptional regulator